MHYFLLRYSFLLLQILQIIRHLKLKINCSITLHKLIKWGGLLCRQAEASDIKLPVCRLNCLSFSPNSLLWFAQLLKIEVYYIHKLDLRRAVGNTGNAVRWPSIQLGMGHLPIRIYSN